MINVFKHLLPRAKAWQITTTKRLRSFFQGLTVLISDPKEFFDLVYLDIFPQTTRHIDEWESQFALPNAGLNEQERRDRLAASWRAYGGQDPRYIQDTLRDAGFDVYVYEWWEPIPEHPTGGSVNNDVIPTARIPFTVIAKYIECADVLSECGEPEAQCGNTIGPVGYFLVNKITESNTSNVGCGSSKLYCNSISAGYSGSLIVTADEKKYTMPPKQESYRYCLYIGGNFFSDFASIPISRKDEFEALCLKICPLEQWLAMLVEYY